MNTTTMGGVIKGKVTRSIVRRLDAPDTRAASSSAMSMFRNAGVNNITPWEISLDMR